MTAPISISFSVSDSYSCHLAVVLTSIAENNPGSTFVFHVLHNGITADNQARIAELSKSYPNCRVAFHFIDASAFDAFPLPKELEHVTREMYYRYILPEVLADESRTIYSDVDVICAGDLRGLWELDLEGNLLAAVSEGESGEFKKHMIGLTGPEPYFYSGLLVMDLEGMRRGGYVRKLFETTASFSNRLSWPDQDVINLVFRSRILQLAPVWDGINVKYRPWRRGIAIWHFPGALAKPWCNVWKNISWPLYLKYLLKSPYRSEALRFVLGHVKGFFYFRYVKKGVERVLVCGIRVGRRKVG